ncbi:MAG: cysteine desulfurase family protein [Myxococcota bacterium]
MIYFDHNAGAPLLPEVADFLARTMPLTGNPSSIHQAGRAARRVLDDARERVAQVLGCTPREIVFTGSGSEAAAIALAGTWRARRERARTKIVTTAIEHPAILGTVDQLEREGAEIVRVRPGVDGAIDAAAVLAAIDERTLVCSVQWVNNETGVIQPVAELARACAARGVLFHTDAVQAFGRVPASLREVPADLLSLSAHKLGGPAGVGVLYNRRGVDVAGLTPGHQENGRRGGTQSVALAGALARALEHAVRHQEATRTRLAALRELFETRVLAGWPGAERNGSAPRVCNTSNLWFPGADGEALLIALDLAGICVSTGAACASGSTKPSHVLLAMGRSSEQASGSLRFSLGLPCSEEDVETVAATLLRLRSALQP